MDGDLAIFLVALFEKLGIKEVRIDVDREGAGIELLTTHLNMMAVPHRREHVADKAIRLLYESIYRDLPHGQSSFNKPTHDALKALFDAAQLNIELAMAPRGWFRLLNGRIERGTVHSAAFDLFAEEEVTVGNVPVAVATGVKTEFSPSLVAIIKEKSGLALKGIEVKAGVIDSDYRDEWKVVLRYPYGKWDVKIGDKIAQFLLVEVPDVQLFGSGIVLKNVDRQGGFGSTGK